MHDARMSACRCIVVDLAASSVRMISSKQAFDTVAGGSPCVITGFAFEHMVKVTHQPTMHGTLWWGGVELKS